MRRQRHCSDRADIARGRRCNGSVVRHGFDSNSHRAFSISTYWRYFALNTIAVLLWAALAIHDTSSVVGAAAKYGAQALVVGTTVKLALSLWIVPLALVTAAVKHSFTGVPLPWFILIFLLRRGG